MVRDELLVASEKDCTKMFVSQPKKGEIMPKVLESGSDVTSFDPDWLIVRVNDSAPKNPSSSIFKSWSFPPENRDKQTTFSDVSSHFAKHPTRSMVPFADFHLIIFLAQLFDIETAAAICSAITGNVDVDPSLVETLRSLG